MKKLVAMLIVILAISFSISACGENKSNNEANVNMNQEAEQVKQEVDEKEEIADEQQTDEETLDISLVGSALLNALNLVKPKTMKIEAETAYAGGTYKTVTYFDGDNTRIESMIPDMGTSVVISLAKENAAYTYTEGATEGIKMIGADLSDEEDMGFSVDSATLFENLKGESDDNFTAKVDTLNGEQVIYIETKDVDPEMGEITVKMWFSAKYGAPLKYEVISGTEIMMTYMVTNIEINTNLDKALFEAPSGVTFQEVDLEAMMSDW